MKPGKAPWSSVLAILSWLNGCGTSTECADYLSAPVAKMRQASGSGCFELAQVVVVARTPSTTTPRLYVQDVKGGDFSAIMAKCDVSSAHSCPPATLGKLMRVLVGAAVTVRGYYQQGAVSGFEELYLDDVVDQGTLLSTPPPVVLQVADLARTKRSRAQWFQVAAATVPSDDPLVMYDFSPQEFALAGPCPSLAGFGMIPASVAAKSAVDCAGNMNPRTVAQPDPREILIGREFFSGFWASTDCACAAASKQHLLTPSNTVVGPIRGVLILQLSHGSSTAYQVFEPLSQALFPVSR